jgi:hypothetical protein
MNPSRPRNPSPRGHAADRPAAAAMPAVSGYKAVLLDLLSGPDLVLLEVRAHEFEHAIFGMLAVEGPPGIRNLIELARRVEALVGPGSGVDFVPMAGRFGGDHTGRYPGWSFFYWHIEFPPTIRTGPAQPPALDGGRSAVPRGRAHDVLVGAQAWRTGLPDLPPSVDPGKVADGTASLVSALQSHAVVLVAERFLEPLAGIHFELAVRGRAAVSALTKALDHAGATVGDEEGVRILLMLNWRRPEVSDRCNRELYPDWFFFDLALANRDSTRPSPPASAVLDRIAEAIRVANQPRDASQHGSGDDVRARQRRAARTGSLSRILAACVWPLCYAAIVVLGFWVSPQVQAFVGPPAPVEDPSALRARHIEEVMRDVDRRAALVREAELKKCAIRSDEETRRECVGLRYEALAEELYPSPQGAAR